MLNAGIADEVWLIPTGDRQDKTIRATAPQRLKMLQLFLQENFEKEQRVKLELCQIEGRIAGSYTIDLLRYFKALYPGFHFSFVIGSDLIPQLPSWKDAETLYKETDFLVLPRPGFPTGVASQARLTVMDLQYITPSPASSSEARRLVDAQKTTAEVLTPAVASYINKNRLYRADSPDSI